MAHLEWSDALNLDLPLMDDTHREFVDLLARGLRAAAGQRAREGPKDESNGAEEQAADKTDWQAMIADERAKRIAGIDAASDEVEAAVVAEDRNRLERVDRLALRLKGGRRSGGRRTGVQGETTCRDRSGILACRLRPPLCGTRLKAGIVFRR